MLSSTSPFALSLSKGERRVSRTGEVTWEQDPKGLVSVGNAYSEHDLAELCSNPQADTIPGLVDEVTRVYALLHDERVKRAERFVDRMLADVNSYQSHKETMAHAGLLVMIAVVGGLVSFKPWPPQWVPVLQVYFEQQTVAVLICVLLWFMIHLYIRWQLRRRRWAAVVYNGAVGAVAEWLRRDPTGEDLKYEQRTTKSCALGACLLTVIDYVVPCAKAPLDDLWKVGSAKGAVRAEWLVTLGSYSLLVILLAKMLYR
ncbi:MAG: hypothetical protein HY695_00860 [Deltaproteobacteria bacterium]|nr:hypothetical protein [Deltaproteobacteria bacterium]